MVRAVDWLGPPELLRVVGALWFGVLVLVAARVGLEIGGRRAAASTAVVVAALLVNPVIDVVAIKGEQLGMPFVLLSVLCTVTALRRESAWLALLAGLCGAIAPGFKQNLVSGLVFAAVVLVGARLAGRLSTRTTLRLGAVGLAGALVPVLLTIGWAELAGVRLHTLWYATFGFRTDASLVLADGGGPRAARALLLLAIAVRRRHRPGDRPRSGGICGGWKAAACLGGPPRHHARRPRRVVVSGSHWRDYLAPPFPRSRSAGAAARRRRQHRPSGR